MICKIKQVAIVAATFFFTSLVLKSFFHFKMEMWNTMKNTGRNTVMNKFISESIRRIGKRYLSPVPSHISKNYIHIDITRLHSIEKSIKENYHTGWRSEKNYSKENYQNDLNAHLFKRLESDRRMVIPWLDNATTLQNKRILEIGCGTGSSTIALSEQGAKVTGIDIDEGALLVAKERVKVYGVDAELSVLSSQNISSTFYATKFDIIIFFACLEHMTIVERLSSLKDAWEMLPTCGLLVIVETPNRLWYFDGHTSFLPFFHWLPNELSFAYSKFSSRENFHELYNDYNATSKENFLRRGRGMSFHEIDIAIGHARNLKVISSLSTYKGISYKLNKAKIDRQYKSILMKIYPNIHEGFLDDSLYLIIKKEQ
jgi:2-polyprenyl-3-methyl-5-hydroxy-6-metoxy-1,4-benzoquinol methylase